jgi:hypothetical protein
MRDTLCFSKWTGAAELSRRWRAQTVLALYPSISAVLGCVTMGRPTAFMSEIISLGVTGVIPFLWIEILTIAFMP